MKFWTPPELWLTNSPEFIQLITSIRLSHNTDNSMGMKSCKLRVNKNKKNKMKKSNSDWLKFCKCSNTAFE